VVPDGTNVEFVHVEALFIAGQGAILGGGPIVASLMAEAWPAKRAAEIAPAVALGVTG